jgi:hypothetical protein
MTGGPQAKILSSRFGGSCQQSSLHPGPDVVGAQDGFLWCHHLDLFFLVAKLPLVGAMWRVYAATSTSL